MPVALPGTSVARLPVLAEAALVLLLCA